jgi:glycosyltransferase involved in cell wall biosynthesis
LATLRVLPLQPAARLPDVLATGDVLIALVEADAGSFSVPSKVQSYLCAGRPILMAAPRENLAARIVVRENAGIVVDPHDEAGFVAAALRLQNDPALRAEMGANGRAYAERSYDIVAVADRFEQVLQTAAKRARLPRPARGIDNRQHLGEVETYP